MSHSKVTIKVLANNNNSNMELLCTENDLKIIKSYLMLDTEDKREVNELVMSLADNTVIIDN